MTTTPYRTNAAERPRDNGRGRVWAWTRPALIVLGAVVVATGVLYLLPRVALAGRSEVARANYTVEARKLQTDAVAWRAAHPMSCPTLVDLGLPATYADMWNTGYAIECTTTTTTVRSAGPDRVYFTPDDIRYPE